MTQISVFISYRRDGDAARAVMLDRVITGTFNTDVSEPAVDIYRDTSERLGVSWPLEIQEKCGSADIVLVVIGPGWLQAADGYGRRRIDQADDWVRQEIELALTSGNTVIPLAFGGQEMLPRQALPESIADLAARRGTVVRDEYTDDLQPVLQEIKLHLSPEKKREPSTDVGSGAQHLPYPHPPLVIKPEPLSPNDIAIALEQLLPKWRLARSPLPEDVNQQREELYREFVFPSFLEVLAFMREVADFANNANHHPRWENIFRTLRVYLTTWDIGHRISQLDVQFAQYLDRTYGQQNGPNA